MKIKCVWSEHPHWFKEGKEYEAKRDGDVVLVLQDEQVSDLDEIDCWRARACTCGILDQEHFTVRELAVFVEAEK